MLNVTERFNNLMSSAVRPRIIPRISVDVIDNEGNASELLWTADNIVDLKFERGIDFQGNELPYMELTWTEVYEGRLNEQAYPEKYNNLTKFMACQLTWTQYFTLNSNTTAETWQGLYDNYTWKSLYDSGATWNLQAESENINFPLLFVDGRPQIKNNTIIWKAVDVLSFLEFSWTRFFNGTKNETSIVEIVLAALVEARAIVWDNEKMRNLIQISIEKIRNHAYDNSHICIYEDVLCNGKIKEQMALACAIADLYLDFDENGAIVLKELLYNQEQSFVFDGNILYKYPKLTFGTPMQSFLWKQYWLNLDELSPYSLHYTSLEEPSVEIAEGANEFSIATYNFNGLGQTYKIGSEDSDEETYSSNVNCDMVIVEDGEIPPYLFVKPIVSNQYERSLESAYVTNGEIINEDNPLCGKDDALERFAFLEKLNRDGEVEMEFETAGNIAITTSDRVAVETNLYDSDGNKIVKSGIAKRLTIEYNGAVREKAIVKELSIWQS